MRVIQFILICVLLGASSAKAQRAYLSGTKVGVSMSSFSGEHESDYLVSELYGIFANIPISDKFSIQTEFDLGLIGWYKTKYDNLSIPTLSWPLLLKYYPGKDFNFQFGGALNFLLMDAYVYDANFIQEGSMPYHRYDSGLCGGLGFDFSRIQIYLRYYQGVVNINPLRNIWVGTESGSEFLDYTERNTSFQFGIEYKLIKKQKKEKQYGRKYAKPH
mgnify:FL=1